MVSLNEALGGGTPLAGVLSSALDTISSEAQVEFTAYVRFVLPLDGYVFWVKASIANDRALQPVGLSSATNACTVSVPCALHATTDTEQNEDESLDYSHIIITAKDPIRQFHDTATDVLWVGNWQGIRFAVNSRTMRFEQSGLQHYVAGTIYPAMLSQFIDDAKDFDATTPVVSNSLPFWLSMAANTPLYPWLPKPPMPFYPSFLLPDNITPPYAVVSIDSGRTQPLQGAAYIDKDSSRWQLVSERVDLIVYGARNDDAMNVLDYANQWMLDTNNMGLMNIPVVRDDRRPQAEANVLAQRKTISFEVNYYQAAGRDIVRQLILAAVPSLTAI